MNDRHPLDEPHMEDAGRSRGARLAMLDTSSFQPPARYQRHGYKSFGDIEGYGDQHTKQFLRETLT